MTRAIVIPVALLFFSVQFTLNVVAQSKKTVAQELAECGKLNSIFRGDWWNYYERGLIFMDCEKYDLAIADFLQALEENDLDIRREYTSGLRIINAYFPNRELGICYYRIQNYVEAQKYLNQSLSDFPTTKAEYYLNRTRSNLSPDTVDPNIVFNDSASPFLTFHDNEYVEKVWVNGEEQIWQDSKQIEDALVSIQKAKPWLKIELPESLLANSPYLFVKATDISGNTSIKRIPLQGQLENPEFTLITSELNAFGEWLVELEIKLPDTKITNVSINDKKQGVNDVKILNYADIIRQSSLNIEITGLTDSATKVWTKQFNLNEHAPLSLALDNTSGNAQWDKILITGRAKSGAKVRSVKINGQYIAGNFLDSRFQYLVNLPSEMNEIRVTATDYAGKETTESITYSRKIPLRFDVKNRLATIGYLFDCGLYNDSNCSLDDDIFNDFYAELDSKKRFNLTNQKKRFKAIRWDEICQHGFDEYKELCTESKKHLRPSFSAIHGEIEIRSSVDKNVKDSQELFLRLVNAASGDIMIAFDAYFETDMTLTLEQQMVAKILQKFPIATSTKNKHSKDNIIVEFETGYDIWENMPMVIYSGDEICGKAAIELSNDDTKVLSNVPNCLNPTEVITL